MLVRLDERDMQKRDDTLSIYVRLASGEYLWLDVEDRVTVRLLGVPIGFFTGIRFSIRNRRAPADHDAGLCRSGRGGV